MEQPPPSIGVAVRMPSRGKLVADYVQRAMSAEVLKCNAEGLSSLHDAAIIHDRMMAVHDALMEQLRAQDEARLPK